jgi:hypothetical protein
MERYDVFNGDADGLCALQQLRLKEPVASTLVTGVKRDIRLLARVPAGEGDVVTALDISLDSNRQGLLEILERGASVQYFDHHFAGDIPQHERLQATIDTSPDVCTSLLVDRALEGGFRPWAVVAAFGDNLDQSARRAAEGLRLDAAQIDLLRELGTYLNYNAYGATVDDLYFSPEELFRRMQPHQNPFAFLEADDAFDRLRAGYAEDMTKARGVAPIFAHERGEAYVMPAEPWARRVSGVFANELAKSDPLRSYALLTRLPSDGYVVSVRVPKAAARGADELCRQFPTGGGRRAAAGINHLPEAALDEFVQKFEEACG